MSTDTVRPPTDTPKRRSQAIAGALAGLAIVLVLVAVFIIVKANKSDSVSAAPMPAAAAAPPSEQVAPEPSAPVAEEPSAPAAGAVQTPAGLEKKPVVKGGGTAKLTKTVVTPLIKGTGATVRPGQTITVNYVLVKYADGTPIESSWDSGQPFSTPIGAGKLIKGWDQTIPGQKVGSRLQLDIPAADAYGADPGDLRFVVDILAAK